MNDKQKHNEIELWPPIGGFFGRRNWLAVWYQDGQTLSCEAPSKKSVLAKARRIIAKSKESK